MEALSAESRLVVVGASLAGLRAVEAARRLGFAGSITLLGAEPHLPYDRPPLSKDFLDEKEEPTVPTFRTREHLERELGVDLLLGQAATDLDTGARTVGLGEREIPYDGLVIATGGRARSLPAAEGRQLGCVHTLRDLDDAIAVRAALDAGAEVVVVGAGFIGSEVASAARRRGLPVTLLEAGPLPLERSVGRDVGAVCVDLHRRYGTDLRVDAAVVALEGDRSGHVRWVVLADGSRVRADLVVVGIGVTPATGWLVGSGLELHPRDGAVLCDPYLRTSAPGVVAAGDVVHWPHPLLDGGLMRLEHWTSAAEHGAAAATALIAPARARPVETVPYFWSDWYGHRLQFVGTPQADEVIVLDDGSTDGRFLALYRRGDRLTGVLTIDRPAQIMKYRRVVAERGSIAEGREVAARLGSEQRTKRRDIL